jgi:ribosomal protein S27AE
MSLETTWRAPEHCPGCGAWLTLTDDGTGPIRVECASCGYSDIWTVTCQAQSSR